MSTLRFESSTAERLNSSSTFDSQQSLPQSHEKVVRTGRIPRLDLLRFAAAIAVVAFHLLAAPVVAGTVNREQFGLLGHVARYGYLGVDLFFLISGFVIVLSAQSRTARSFIVHRALRLYPSFWVALGLTVMFIIALAPAQAERPSMATIVANLTMLPGRFGEDRIDDVYWTLAVELKFYAIVALLLAVGLFRRVEILACGWVALLVAAELNVGGSLLRSAVIFPYGAFFAAGTIVYLIHTTGWTNVRGVAFASAWILALLAARRAVPDFIPNSTSSDVVVVLMLVTASFLLLLWAASGPSVKSPKAWLFLGSLTYPLYLTHGRIGRLLFANFQLYVDPGFAVLLEAAVVGALAWAIVEIVERRAIPALARSSMIRSAAGENRGPKLEAKIVHE